MRILYLKAACILALGSLASTTATADELRVDTFGNVYDGNSPFSIGKVDSCGAQGKLHTDIFGNVYVGNSPFSVGKVEGSSSKGTIRRDTFGKYYVGDSPFDVDVSKVIKQASSYHYKAAFKRQALPAMPCHAMLGCALTYHAQALLRPDLNKHSLTSTYSLMGWACSVRGSMFALNESIGTATAKVWSNMSCRLLTTS